MVGEGFLCFSFRLVLMFFLFHVDLTRFPPLFPSFVPSSTHTQKLGRNRQRRAKKAARRKQRAAKLADEKLISRLQPGLGLNNPYERRKMREELQAARAGGRVVTGEVDPDAEFKTSTKFFEKMQAEATAAVRGDDDGGKKRKRVGGEEGGRSASSFKL